MGLFRARICVEAKPQLATECVPNDDLSLWTCSLRQGVLFHDGSTFDANDVVAVFLTAREAVQRARDGGGATLIEALSYRLGDHTTADDASRYRSREELNEAWKREPVKRLREYLRSHGHWSAADEQQLQEDAQRQVQAAVDSYSATPIPAATAMFDHLYAHLPRALSAQYQQLAARQGGKP